MSISTQYDIPMIQHVQTLHITSYNHLGRFVLNVWPLVPLYQNLSRGADYEPAINIYDMNSTLRFGKSPSH